MYDRCQGELKVRRGAVRFLLLCLRELKLWAKTLNIFYVSQLKFSFSFLIGFDHYFHYIYSELG